MHWKVFLLLSCLSLLGSVTCKSMFDGPPGHDGHFKLTLLHTNDVHARFEPSDKYGGPCPEDRPGECYGGVARRFTKLQEIRNNTENVLFVDGGDQFQGTIWFVNYEGKATGHFMEALEYDAMVLGNHEFDLGVTGLAPFLENASWPVVSANIDASRDQHIKGLFEKSTVVTVGDRKIGIVGYTVKDTPELVTPGGVSDLVFSDEIPAVEAEVRKLKDEGINIIIALGHAGFSMDKRVAAQVNDLDIVVGGHTNTFLYTGTPPAQETPAGPYPVEVEGASGGKVLVVQDYAYAKYLGRLDLEFDAAGSLVKWEGNPILLDSSVPEDPALKAEIAEWRKPLDVIAKKIAGSTRVYLEGDRAVCRLKECNMGNAMTEAMLLAGSRYGGNGAWSDASIAFWNSGGIRNSIKQGNITMENILSVFPFRNTISKITMLGKHLEEVLEASVTRYDPENLAGAFLQMSGVRVTYSLCRPVGERVRKVEIICSDCSIPEFRPLDPDAVYAMLMSDFMIDGGDNYDMIGDYLIEKTPMEVLDSTAFEEYVQTRSPLTQGVDGRIEFVDDCTTSGSSSTLMATSQYTVLIYSLLFSVYSYC